MARGHNQNVRPINSLGNLLFPLPNETKKIIRLIEKSHYKINGAELAEIFNKICIKEGNLLKYANLRLHDPTAREAPATAKFRRVLIWRQLNERQQKLQRIHEENVALRTRWTALQDLDERGDIEATVEQPIKEYYNRRATTVQHKLVHCNGGSC